MLTQKQILAAVCAAVVAAAGLSAGDPSVESLIREIVKDAKTPAERATKLYEAARTVQGNQKAQVQLLARAVQYGLQGAASRAGQEAAAKSLDLLLEADPKRADQWRAKKLDLLRRAFARAPRKTLRKRALGEKLVAALLEAGRAHEQAGKWREAAAVYREAKFPAHTLNLFVKDEVSRRFSRATHFHLALVKAARHARTLAAHADDAAARLALIECLVVDLDDPAQAAKHLTEDVDERWRTYVRLAAKGVSELKPPASRELGDWYFKVLLSKADSFSQDPLLSRARACYKHFLQSADAKDPQTARAQLALGQIESQIHKREAYKRWINLLAYVDGAAAATRSTWKLTADGPRIFTPAGQSAAIGVPVTPEGSYEAEVTFVRHAWGKPDSVHITCPVGPAAGVNVILDGYGKHIGGFENIRGPGGTTLRDNGTAVPCRVTNEKQYTVHITVEVQDKDARLTVKLLGSPLLKWKGPLTAVVAVPSPPAGFGLGGGWNTSITYKTARLRMLTGTARLPGGPAPPPVPPAP